MNRDNVGKAFDLNSESDIGHCRDLSALQQLVPYVPDNHQFMHLKLTS